jgi:hypothetical protein
LNSTALSISEENRLFGCRPIMNDQIRSRAWPH